MMKIRVGAFVSRFVPVADYHRHRYAFATTIVKRTFCTKIPDIPEHLIKSKQRRVLTETRDISTVDLLQKAMRKVPQQVIVVTTAEYIEDDKKWYKRGVTCSTFNSVSFSPPIISFCLSKQSRMHELMHRTGQFAVHVLGQNQIGHGIHFSKACVNGLCQFETVPHIQNEEGLPIILDSLAVFLCGTHSVHTVGDHHVWYGTVRGASVSDSEQAPLIYFTKSFRSIGDEIFLKAFEDATLPFENWTHQAHLRMAWNYIREYGREEAVPYINVCSLKNSWKRLGIQRFNEVNKDKIKTGYHETITIFFTYLVCDALQRHEGNDFEEFLRNNPHLMDNSLLFQYYNKDTISHQDAKHKFVPPDKKSLPL